MTGGCSDALPADPLPAARTQPQPFLRRHAALAAILALGLGLRLLVLLVYLDTHEWKGETWEHETIVINLLQGKGFMMTDGELVYRSREPPLFAVLCYLLHVVGGPGLWLFYLFQLALAGGIIGLTHAIADRWFSPRAAAAAAVLVAVEPGLVVYHSYKVDDLALGTFLILCVVYATAELSRSRDTRWAAAIGLVIGAGVLTRPDLLGLFGILLAWAWIGRGRLADILKPAGVIFLAASLVIVPWAVRNSLLHGRVVLLTTFSGEALWRGNNPNSTGTSVSVDGRGQLEAAPEEFRSRIAAANEVQRDAVFRAEAVRFIAEAPGQFLRRVATKIYYFWWFTPSYGARHYEWAPSLLKDGYQLLYGATLAFMLAGLWALAREGLTVPRVIVLAVPVCIMLVHSWSYVEGRHRVLVMPLILIVAAYGMIRFPWPRTGAPAGRFS